MMDIQLGGKLFCGYSKFVSTGSDPFAYSHKNHPFRLHYSTNLQKCNKESAEMQNYFRETTQKCKN